MFIHNIHYTNHKYFSDLLLLLNYSNTNLGTPFTFQIVQLICKYHSPLNGVITRSNHCDNNKYVV